MFATIRSTGINGKARVIIQHKMHLHPFSELLVIFGLQPKVGEEELTSRLQVFNTWSASNPTNLLDTPRSEGCSSLNLQQPLDCRGREMNIAMFSER